MIEIKEVLRQWLAGVPKKRIAARVGLDPKTVRRYIARAEACGLSPSDGVDGLTDERLESVLVALKSPPEREPGESWRTCAEQQTFIEGHLAKGVTLTKIHRLLKRRGIAVPYSTLHRYASNELGFSRKPATVAIVDGEPGVEVQVDTGWMTKIDDDGSGRARRFRAFIFTPVVSRYRFVYPVLRENLDTAIEAFEAAWAFYGGVFKVAIVDNLKAIVSKADPLGARIAEAFLEYAQSRGFHIDTARVRAPKDKARVERSVRYVRDDCFMAEPLRDLEAARARSLIWCAQENGLRRHSTTQRLPKEHFEASEAEHLLPTPTERFDVPRWCEPKVARDHFAQVAGALYSLPTRLIGRRLRARADSKTVRFYDRGELVKAHTRQPKGGRSVDPNDFPAEKRGYAMRDVDFLKRQADEHGEAIGSYARALLDSPLPWTRMRTVYSLLRLVQKYGAAAVEKACAAALAVELIDVRRLRRLIEFDLPKPSTPTPKGALPLARYLRPAEQYALRGLSPANDNPSNEDKDKDAE